jgi:hypothetical protein
VRLRSDAVEGAGNCGGHAAIVPLKNGIEDAARIAIRPLGKNLLVVKVSLLAVAALLIAFAVVVVSYGLLLWFTPDPEGGRRWFGNVMLAVGGAAGLVGIGLATLARRRTPG